MATHRLSVTTAHAQRPTDGLNRFNITSILDLAGLAYSEVSVAPALLNLMPALHLHPASFASRVAPGSWEEYSLLSPVGRRCVR